MVRRSQAENLLALGSFLFLCAMVVWFVQSRSRGGAADLRPGLPAQYGTFGFGFASGAAGAGADCGGDGEPVCRRVVWMSGIQVKNENGSASHYMEASAAYMRFYAAALLSAREKAPSLLPVLVTLNEVPRDFLAWVEAQGALVVPHAVTFADRMARNAAPGHLEKTGAQNLLASYARLDAASAMPKVLEALAAREARRAGSAKPGGAVNSVNSVNSVNALDVERDYLLWTDPDVLFREDIDSCSLPRPGVLSIGPEMKPGTVFNCGVMHINVRGFARALPSVLDFADANRWKFANDQDLVVKFFTSEEAAPWRKPWHRLSALPDAYNWKAYWGEPEPGWLTMFTSLKGKAVIIHTHGPKPETALCVIGQIKARVPDPSAWKPRDVVAWREALVSACRVQTTHFVAQLLQMMAAAYTIDGGALYKWVMSEQDRLCPGSCWATTP